MMPDQLGIDSDRVRPIQIAALMAMMRKRIEAPDLRIYIHRKDMPLDTTRPANSNRVRVTTRYAPKDWCEASEACRTFADSFGIHLDTPKLDRNRECRRLYTATCDKVVSEMG